MQLQRTRSFNDGGDFYQQRASRNHNVLLMAWETPGDVVEVALLWSILHSLSSCIDLSPRGSTNCKRASTDYNVFERCAFSVCFHRRMFSFHVFHAVSERRPPLQKPTALKTHGITRDVQSAMRVCVGAVECGRCSTNC